MHNGFFYYQTFITFVFKSLFQISMPNRINFRLLLCFLCFYSVAVTPQTPTAPSSDKDAITTAFENYFSTDRENIHVQLDKNIFMTNETIWFKGYVYNKKLGLPFYSTTNVYVQLMDESGNILTRQLLYSMSGLFSGKIKLNKEFKSGYYYLQFYTNWMNNFEEDESYVQRVKIINTLQNNLPIKETINPQKINVDFYPEGGSLIANNPNTVGVKVSDINGKPITDCVLEIQDENNTLQNTVVINSFGMGKFEYLPDGRNLKAVLLYKESKTAYILPEAKPDGIALEINNYIFENKTFVKIKYNKDYLKTLKNNNLYLVIQKNEKSNIVDIRLDPETRIKEFFFSNDLLFSGVNSIRIIDQEMNEMAQRLLFVPIEKKTSTSLHPGFKDHSKVDLSGNTNWPDACVSVSTLPSETKIAANENIITTFTLNAYLNEKLSVRSDYFNEISRAKKHELDLMMLTQRSNKYDWNTIKGQSVKPLYQFEKGLDIKGTINSTSADLKKCRLQLKNMLGDVLASTEVVDKNGFLLKETAVTDSLMVYAHLIDAKDRSKQDMSYYLTIVNKNKKYNKSYIPVPYTFPEKASTADAEEIQLPFFDGIVLDEVEIKQEKIRLKRQSQTGNSMLRGYKVGVDVSENYSVLDFISQNGFNVSNSAGTVTISGRSINSINMQQFSMPAVFIDGRELLQFDELIGMRMSELDEIYISSIAVIPSILNRQGVIRMYRKQPDFSAPDPTNKPKMLVGGFETITPFENADYKSEYSIGFKNLGLIHWAPWVLSDENGNIKVVIPNNNHPKVRLLIEGFTFDGTLISEIKEVEVSE